MKDRISQIDTLIRGGRMDEAKAKLRVIKASELNRTEILKVAQLFRRVDQPQESIRLLKPFVNEEFPANSPAMPAEVAEYAVALTRIGASRYALGLLDRLPPSNDYRVDFAWSAAHFARWRYKEAIPYLERYIASGRISSYERHVGEVNLLAARLFTGDLEGSESLAKSLLTELRQENRTLLLTNVFELAAQLEFQRQNYVRARNYLEEGQRLVHDPKSIYSLYVRKWLVAIDLLERGATKRELARLQEVRQAAERAKAWEVTRDCDFFLARATRDESLFLQLYFGTPFDRYRANILAEMPKNFRLPSRWTWMPLGKSRRSLDLIMARSSPEGTAFKPDHSLFLLLHAFFVDFYAPRLAVTLFCELFPDEIFDPHHSPLRVIQLIKRLNPFFRANDLPLRVERDQGEARLSLTEPIAVIVPARFDPQSSREIYLRRLHEKWPLQSFSAQECALHLKISLPTAIRILNWGIEKGLIGKSGQTSYARYQVEKSFAVP